MWRTCAIILLSTHLATVTSFQCTPPAQPTRPLDPAVKRDGWWMRVNNQSKAEKITWRFSDPSKRTEPAILTWQKGNDPDNVDFPETMRLVRNIGIEVSVEPADVRASVCLFYAQQGVQLVQVSKPAKLTLDSRTRDKNCVP